MCLPGVMVECYMVQESNTSSRKYHWKSPIAAPAHVQLLFFLSLVT